MELIIITPEQLESTFNRFLGNFLKNQSPESPQSDKCNLSDALKVTGLSKSKMYKLTSTNKIPFESYNNRLVFSRKKLEAWIKDKTFIKHDYSGAILNLAKCAERKSSTIK
ncbi:MAG: helix-turn-helix domain-containing protein [Sphingobacteriaceae bacterium]